MEKQKPIISELNRSLLKIVWKFGPKGLEDECCDSLTLPEFMALEKISTTRDCPVRGAGTPLGFSKSGATRVVGRLEKKGYVVKIRSAEDTRVCCVKITAKGERTLCSANRHYEKEFSDLAARMPDYSFEDTAAFIMAMGKSVKN